MSKRKSSPKDDKTRKRELEDYEPGATREEVLAALRRTAQPTKEESPRRSKKRDE